MAGCQQFYEKLKTRDVCPDTSHRRRVGPQGSAWINPHKIVFEEVEMLLFLFSKYYLAIYLQLAHHEYVFNMYADALAPDIQTQFHEESI